MASSGAFQGDEEGARQAEREVAWRGGARASTQLLRGEGRKTTGEVLVGWAAGGLALGCVGKFAPGEPPSVLFTVF